MLWSLQHIICHWNELFGSFDFSEALSTHYTDDLACFCYLTYATADNWFARA